MSRLALYLEVAPILPSPTDGGKALPADAVVSNQG